MILVTIAGRIPRAAATQEYVPDWGKANMDAFRKDLAEHNWEDFENSTNESWQNFKETIDALQAKHFFFS